MGRRGEGGEWTGEEASMVRGNTIGIIPDTLRIRSCCVFSACSLIGIQHGLEIFNP